MRNDLQKDQAKRLRAARESMFEKIEDGWKHVRRVTDVSQSAYTHHENGTRGYKARADSYAKAFNTTPEWLLWGTVSVQKSGIPIVGKAGASTTDGYYLNAYADGAHPTLDPYPEGSISVDVEGDSMVPRFFAGENLVFGPVAPSPEPFIGQEVLAYLGDDDGRTLIKILDRNKTTGNYNLRSYNPHHPIIEDVTVAWVRPFLGMRK